METEDTKSVPRTRHLPEGQVEERSATEDCNVDESRKTEKINESYTKETLYSRRVDRRVVSPVNNHNNKNNNRRQRFLNVFFNLWWGEKLRRRVFFIF